MHHVVLLGDSIFDNASYVPGEPPVVDQLRGCLPEPWQVTLLAVDGEVTSDVMRRAGRRPRDTSHLVISCGGNDALRYRDLLNNGLDLGTGLLDLLTEARANFQSDYGEMLANVMRFETPVAVCTIYDSVPGLELVEQIALAIFNEVILREAATRRLPVIDLRIICTEPADYSAISPIEPSATGGEKIARAIGDVLTNHDFFRDRCVVYS